MHGRRSKWGVGDVPSQILDRCRRPFSLALGICVVDVVRTLYWSTSKLFPQTQGCGFEIAGERCEWPSRLRTLGRSLVWRIAPVSFNLGKTALFHSLSL